MQSALVRRHRMPSMLRRAAARTWASVRFAHVAICYAAWASVLGRRRRMPSICSRGMSLPGLGRSSSTRFIKHSLKTRHHIGSPAQSLRPGLPTHDPLMYEGLACIPTHTHAYPHPSRALRGSAHQALYPT
eukprot:1143426-Pelagomonas_calceolata.AAC.8